MVVRKYFLTIVIALLITALLVWQWPEKSIDDHFVKELQAKQEKKIDSLIKQNDSLQVIINLRAEEIDSLKKAYSGLEKEVIIINTSTDEKINAINNYDTGELQQYFTDRYK